MHELDRSIRSPCDAFVIEMASHGETVAVTKGQVMARLSSAELDRARSRLQMSMRAVEIAFRPFKDGRTDEVLALLPLRGETIDASIARSRKELFRLAGHRDPRSYYGSPETMPMVQMELDALEGECKKLAHYVDIEYAQARRDDAASLLDTARTQLQHELEYVNALSRTLTISAPTEGEFTGLVGRGAFVPSGKRLGRFNP